MDHQPGVAPDVVDTSIDPPVQADQAIFTSIPSAMGEGYRIIAAGSGVRAVEKTAITKHSPSHESLCDSSADATALSSYPLGKGRYCIAVSRYAGTEHTARGGQRVYTHMVLLDDPDFARFGYNPVSVQTALVRAVGATAILKPPRFLEPVTLTEARSSSAGSCDIDQVLSVVSLLLVGRPVIVFGDRVSVEFLDSVLLALPIWLRRTLSATVGLKFSLARATQLSLIDGHCAETRRAITGHNTEWVDLASPPARQSSPFDAYLELIRRWWNEGRILEIDRLARTLSAEVPPEESEMTAETCDDNAKTNTTDPNVLQDLS